jgi:hypothetical protein
MASASRTQTLRAGAACQRCRRGKTRCVYENGQPPCKNCAKGMHDCYLPSEGMTASHTTSPARNLHRPRDSLPERGLSSSTAERTGSAASALPRHAASGFEKYVYHLSLTSLLLSLPRVLSIDSFCLLLRPPNDPSCGWAAALHGLGRCWRRSFLALAAHPVLPLCGLRCAETSAHGLKSARPRVSTLRLT